MTFDTLAFAGPFRIAEIRWTRIDGSYHRETRAPGDDISDLPAEVQAAITAEWTPEVIAAYQASLAEPAPLAAERARIAALLALADVAALLTLLKTSTGPQIDIWAASNANSLPEIRDVLKTLLKLLAARL